jgi:hypothetical protein
LDEVYTSFPERYEERVLQIWCQWNTLFSLEPKKLHEIDWDKNPKLISRKTWIEETKSGNKEEKNFFYILEQIIQNFSIRIARR